MKFFGWMLLLLGILEVLSIVLVADWLGGGITLLLLIASVIIGLVMMRNIGFSAILMAGESVRGRQNMSLYQMLWPIRFVAAALLLISPGFASDVAALVLMLPLKGKNRPGQTPFGPRPGNQRDDVIEGEYTVHPEQDQAAQRLSQPMRRD